MNEFKYQPLGKPTFKDVMIQGTELNMTKGLVLGFSENGSIISCDCDLAFTDWLQLKAWLDTHVARFSVTKFGNTTPVKGSNDVQKAEKQTEEDDGA